MKAIVICEPGGPEKLMMKERPVPKVRPGWSLVRVRGFGINHSEIFTRKGLSPSVAFPRILGIECVGTIKETTDPERLPAGLRVLSIMGEMGRAFDGSYAEFVLLPNEQIYPVRSHLSWAELAAVPETYYTAYGSFKNLRIEGGQRLLVRGAASGVGIAFLKLVKGLDASIEVFGSSRNPDKGRSLEDLGYDGIIRDREGRLETEASFDRILDLVGPRAVRDSLSHLREEGILCSTGQLGGAWYLEDFDPIMELKNNVYLTTFYSGNVSEKKMNEMLSFIEEHKIRVRPEKIFSLDQVSEAHRWMEEKGSFGKCVVLPFGEDKE